MSYELVYTRQAKKDARKLKGTPLAQKAREPNPLRPRAFGGKGAEGMKKEIPSNQYNRS